MSSKTKLQENLSNVIQSLLNKFKTSRNVDHTSFQFKANPTVYILESQVPEIWLKSKNPINKNDVFYNFLTNLPPNSFPKCPYIIPIDESLKSKEVHVGKIEIDELFGETKNYQVIDVFGDEFSLAKEKTVTKKPSIKIPEEDKKEEKEEEKDDHNSSVKKWFINFPNKVNYGPYTGEEIFIFLTNLYERKNIEKPDFMVADSESDFYFKPESLYEILSEDENLKKKRSENKLGHSLENRVEPTLIKKKSLEETELQERRLFENTRTTTKFDNPKFENAKYIPLPSLRKQMSELRLASSLSHDGLKAMPQSTKNSYVRRTPRNKYEMGSNISNPGNVEAGMRMRLDMIKSTSHKTSLDFRNKFSNAVRLSESTKNANKVDFKFTSVTTDQLFS